MKSYNLKRILSFLLLFSALTYSFAGGKQDEATVDEPETTESETIVAETTETGTTESADFVVAEVNGESIMASTLETELMKAQQMYMAQGQTIMGDQLDLLRTSVLDSLISQILLIQKCDELGLTPDMAAIDAEINGYIEQMGDEGFNAALEAQGYTIERLREEIGESLVIQEYVQNNVFSEISVSEEDSLAYYTENEQYFVEPASVKASHILFQVAADADEATREDALSRANDVLAKAQAGDDFAELAIAFSEGPSGPSGGDLGFFSAGQMVPEFETAAFALAIGDVSGIVETQFGYHIIKVFDKTEAREVPFEEVNADIIAYLESQKQSETYQTYVSVLRASADVVMN